MRILKFCVKGADHTAFWTGVKRQREPTEHKETTGLKRRKLEMKQDKSVQDWLRGVDPRYGNWATILLERGGVMNMQDMKKVSKQLLDEIGFPLLIRDAILAALKKNS